MAEHEKHEHFYCPKCGAGFCSEREEYIAMKEGDACPECHISTVKLVETASFETDFIQPFLEELQQVIGPQNNEMIAANSFRKRIAEALERIVPILEDLRDGIGHGRRPT